MCRGRSICEIFVPSAQFYCEPKTTLKIKSIKKKKQGPYSHLKHVFSFINTKIYPTLRKKFTSKAKLMLLHIKVNIGTHSRK